MAPDRQKHRWLPFFAAMATLLIGGSTLANVHHWSHGRGEGSFDMGYGICADNMGNIYAAGRYDTPASTYLTKFNNGGDVRWVKTSAGNVLASSVVADASGNVYVGGNFTDTVWFGGDSLTSAGHSDLFLVKFSPDGNHLWSRSFGDAAYEYCNGLAVGPDGGLVVVGDFNGDVDFGGGVIETSWWTTIVASYDPDGNYRWANAYASGHTGTPSTSANGVAVDGAGNVVIAGDFWLDTNLGGANLINNGYYDAFVAKYDSDGAHLWSSGYGGSSYDGVLGIALDGSSPVVCGYFNGTVSFGGAGLTSTAGDCFAAKYDAFGNHTWSRAFGSSGSDYAYGVDVDDAGNCVFTGSVGGVGFFGGPATTHHGGDDMFLAILDDSGTHLWSAQYGGTGTDDGRSACFDPWGGVAVTGRFAAAADFGGDILPNAGDDDMFVARYASEATSVGTRTAIGRRLNAYPNPFNPTTTIRYAVGRAGPVTLGVYDVSGRPIDTIVDAVHHNAGIYTVSYTPTLPSGVYMLRIVSQGMSEAIRLVLIK